MNVPHAMSSKNDVNASPVWYTEQLSADPVVIDSSGPSEKISSNAPIASTSTSAVDWSPSSSSIVYSNESPTVSASNGV